MSKPVLESSRYLRMEILRLPQVRSFAWLAVDKGFRFLFGTLVGVAVARHLGPIIYGSLSYTLAIVSIAMIVTSAGLDSILRREVLKHSESAADILTTGMLIRCILGSVAYLFFIVSVWTEGTSNMDHRLLMILGILAFQPALQIPEIWYQCELNSGAAVRLQAISLVVCGLVRMALILRHSSVFAFAWTAVAEVAFAGLLLWVSSRRAGLILSWTRANWTKGKKLLEEAWPLLLSGLSVAVYMRIDTIMLRHMLGERSVGQYAAATKLTEIWLFIPGALSVSFLPGLLDARARGRETYDLAFARYCDVSTLICYGIALPMAALAHWIIPLAYGRSFEDAARILVVHVWILIFSALGVVRGQFCVNEGLTRFHLCSTVLGALINVVLNLVLIPRFGGAGAAGATLVAQALAAWISSYGLIATRRLANLQTQAILLPFRFSALRRLWLLLQSSGNLYSQTR